MASPLLLGMRSSIISLSKLTLKIKETSLYTSHECVVTNGNSCSYKRYVYGENGFRIDPIELNGLRRFVREITDTEIELPDEALTDAAKTCGTLFRGKIHTVFGVIGVEVYTHKGRIAFHQILIGYHKSLNGRGCFHRLICRGKNTLKQRVRCFSLRLVNDGELLVNVLFGLYEYTAVHKGGYASRYSRPIFIWIVFRRAGNHCNFCFGSNK